MNLEWKFRKYNKSTPSKIPIEYWYKNDMSAFITRTDEAGYTFVNNQGLYCQVMGEINIGHDHRVLAVKFLDKPDFIVLEKAKNVMKHNRAVHPLFKKAIKEEKQVEIIEDVKVEYVQEKVYLVKVKAPMYRNGVAFKISFGIPSYDYLDLTELKDGDILDMEV